MTIQSAIGQEVAYGKHHWDTLLYGGKSRVAKINGHGHIILENGKVFDKNGRARPDVVGSSWSDGSRLMTVKAYDAHHAARGTRQSRQRLVVEIAHTLNEYASYGFTDEQKAALQDKIGRL
jgi:hypothetical protein